MRVLITGAGGLLGPYLVDAFSEHDVFLVLHRRSEDALKKILKDAKPDVVIHAAAMTNIDECEEKVFSAVEANTFLAHKLVAMASPKSKFVYISTDMVYPDTRGPHQERDAGPVNIYGRTKLAGERAAALNGRHLICRTNFFGPSRTDGKRSFSDWARGSLQDGRTATFYNDVLWNPLHMETLSGLILGLVERDAIGIYNLGARTIMTKAAFVGFMAEHLGLLDKFNKAIVGPSSFKTRRPKDLSMDIGKIEELGFEMPSLEEEIKKL